MKLMSLTPLKPVRLLMLLVFALFMGITSCDEQDGNPLQGGIDENDVESVSTEQQLEAAFEDLDLISVEADAITDEGNQGGREHIDESDRLTRCATVTHNKEEKTIVIDFGDGCTGPDGKLRSGKIIITYTQRMFIPGAVLTFTLENYTVNGIGVEGTKTITNVSESLRADVSFNKVLEGGKLTWPDGTFATREVNKTFTWIRENNPLLDEVHVTGEASGINRRGVAYHVTIISKIVWKRSCRVRGVCVPVQGLKLIEREGHPDVLVDFGDGECDTKVTITKNGESRVVEVDC